MKMSIQRHCSCSQPRQFVRSNSAVNHSNLIAVHIKYSIPYHLYLRYSALIWLFQAYAYRNPQADHYKLSPHHGSNDRGGGSLTWRESQRSHYRANQHQHYRQNCTMLMSVQATDEKKCTYRWCPFLVVTLTGHAACNWIKGVSTGRPYWLNSSIFSFNFTIRLEFDRQV